MNNIDALTMRAFVVEEYQTLKNAKIQKIQQPSRKELILTIRSQSETKKLYINISAEFYHLCFMNKINEIERNIIQPKSPPMFCMLLRKYVENAKILDVINVKNERIIEIIFENYNEFSERTPYCLAIELMGKHSNIVLYNYETNVIVGCAHNIGAEKSIERELIGGYPYVYPPKQYKKDIAQTQFKDFFNLLKTNSEKLHIAISKNFFYITQPLALEFCRKNIKNYDETNIFTAENIENVYNDLVFITTTKTFFPCCDENFEYFTLQDFMDLKQKFSSVNEMIDEFFTQNYKKYLYKQLQNKLFSALNKNLKKQSVKLQKLEKNIQKYEKGDSYKEKADLIMANLYSIKDYKNEVLLQNFETAKNVIVELDPAIGLIENANKYYGLYNKSKKAKLFDNQIISETNNEIELLKEYIFTVKNAENLKELREIEEELQSKNKTLTQKNVSKNKKECNVKKLIIDGFEVYIGKNNKQNDYIYSKISSSEDFWFHALNVSGSHVLLKTVKNTKIEEKTLYECAKLAKEYSAAKNRGKAAVIYARRKYVKKPPCVKAGYVTFKNEIEIIV